MKKQVHNVPMNEKIGILIMALPNNVPIEMALENVIEKFIMRKSTGNGIMVNFNDISIEEIMLEKDFSPEGAADIIAEQTLVNEGIQGRTRYRREKIRLIRIFSKWIRKAHKVFTEVEAKKSTSGVPMNPTVQQNINFPKAAHYRSSLAGRTTEIALSHQN